MSLNSSISTVELTDEEALSLERKLESYDALFFPKVSEGQIRIGVKKGGDLIAGIDACITSFQILYVSTVYVAEPYRREGIGRLLFEELEKRAKKMDVNMIRLDSFNWQGVEFYKAIGFEEVGFYENLEDGFSESFFVKRIG